MGADPANEIGDSWATDPVPHTGLPALPAALAFRGPGRARTVFMWVGFVAAAAFLQEGLASTGLVPAVGGVRIGFMLSVGSTFWFIWASSHSVRGGLYRTGDAQAGSVVFSAAFGACLLARNWRSLGEEGRARRCARWTTGIGLMVPLGFMGSADRLPMSMQIGAFTVYVAGLLTVFLFEAREQRNFILSIPELARSHSISSVGAVLVGLCLVAGIVVAWVVDAGVGYRGVVRYAPGEEVYYDDPITERDARAVGNYLREQGFLDGKGAKTVLCHEERGMLIVMIGLRDDAWKNAAVVETFHQLRIGLTERLSNVQIYRVAEIQLCDSSMRVVKRIQPGMASVR